jgi:hypothetical protein
MKRFLLLIFGALLAGALMIGPAAADDDGGTEHWRVTIENLTPAGSQPLSPPLFVVHSSRADVWSVGEIASHGVAAIAEDADNSVLVSALPQVDGVKSAVTAPGEAMPAPIPSGGTRTYTVETGGSFNRLSVLTMLVNTNDAFTGLDSFRPRGRGDTLETMAYDAGSEVNNELESHIPGPCCGHPFVRAPEGNLIRMHEGITGRGDLDETTYDWNGAAARITIERI